jgi:hypothetical protein
VGNIADAGAAAGKIRFYSGAQPASANDAASGTLLAESALPDPAWGAAVNGVKTLNDPVSDTVDTAGTVGWARILDSNNVTVLDVSVTATGGGGDLIVSNAVLAVGQPIDIQNNVTLTMPAG